MKKNKKSGYIILLGLLISTIFFSMTYAAQDVMEIMFQPARDHEKIIDLGQTKESVGNEVFRESTEIGLRDGLGNGCFVNNQKISDEEVSNKRNEVGFQGNNEEFCKTVLGGERNKSTFSSSKNPPLIVRITKFLLRMTIVLAITMIIYNGILRIVESSKGGEVKDVKTNIIYIVGGIALALSSLAIINLISSITVSSLNTSSSKDIEANKIDDAITNTINGATSNLKDNINNKIETTKNAFEVMKSIQK